MNLEPLLTQEDNHKKRRKFYIYFDEWTGNIISIGNKQRRGTKDPHLITTDPIAGELMLGIKNLKKWVVADLAEGYKLVLKDDHMRIKKAEDHLSKIPLVKLSDNKDVNVVLYTTSYKLEVNVSRDLIYKLTGKIYNEHIKVRRDATYEKICFYLIEKGNPLHLLETIEIDPIDLIENGYKVFDLSKLANVVSLRNVDIMTRRVFKSYGLKLKQNYVSLDYSLNRKRNKQNHISILNENTTDYTAFSISRSTEGWIIKSNFEHPHEHRIYKDFTIYLTGENPNVLLDKISLPYEKLGEYKEFIVKTKVNPNDCKLLMGEDGMNVTFKFEEMTYA